MKTFIFFTVIISLNLCSYVDARGRLFTAKPTYKSRALPRFDHYPKLYQQRPTLERLNPTLRSPSILNQNRSLNSSAPKSLVPSLSINFSQGNLFKFLTDAKADVKYQTLSHRDLEESINTIWNKFSANSKPIRNIRQSKERDRATLDLQRLRIDRSLYSAVMITPVVVNEFKAWVEVRHSGLPDISNSRDWLAKPEIIPKKSPKVTFNVAKGELDVNSTVTLIGIEFTFKGLKIYKVITILASALSCGMSPSCLEMVSTLVKRLIVGQSSFKNAREFALL